MRADPNWRDYAIYSVLAGVFALIAMIALVQGSLIISFHDWIGLVQRVFLAILFGWLEVLAVRRFVLLSRATKARTATP